MEIHLDLIGGLAGDMFIAALLDAFPQHEPQVMEAIRSTSDGHPVACALTAHRDHVLCGRRFEVRSLLRPEPSSPMRTSGHDHIAWKSIRTRLETATLDAQIRRHAVGIFELLAAAEAHVHGVAPGEVEFHEVGAWDSVADVVGAAALVASLGATRWTASPAPLGSGRVNTAHGILPVPSPATAYLLQGMATLDDGIEGERVTPTGAAILRYLCGSERSMQGPRSRSRILEATGTGFGTRRLAGLSNHVRVLCFSATGQSTGTPREIHVLEFEVDDQSGEDLALGLERIRMNEAVLDVTQSPVFGKKGRMMTHIQVLARHNLDIVIESCFRETTTIGLRHRTVSGVGLERVSQTVELEDGPVRVKIVDRPGGRTAKAESDDVRSQTGHARRAILRRRAESAALQGDRAEIDHA